MGQESLIANETTYLAFSVGHKVLIEENYVKLFEKCYKACGITGKINAHKLARRYIVYQIIKKINSYPSRRSIATAEFGVLDGLTSMIITSTLNGKDDSHYIFDSFEGLSEPESTDFEGGRGEIYKGMMSPSHKKISTLFPSASIQKCWIPQTIKPVDKMFDFVHIDLDLYDPVKGALEYLIDKCNSGCIVIVDDYSDRWPGCVRAVQEHLSRFPNLYDYHYDTCMGNYFIRRR